MKLGILTLAVAVCFGASVPELQTARDKQDRPTLEKLTGELSASAQAKQGDASAQYMIAMAESYLSEILLELRLKNEAKSAAEAGIKAAERAVALKPDVAEYHRILGTLCGQVIPANVLAGLKYGKCAQDSVEKAVQLDPKSADAYVSRGVGNYYLPASFGGGVDKALKDFDKAIQLNAKLADAYLWKGIALRKANQMPEAHKALSRALELNPNRLWAKQLLDKTPAQ